MPEGRQRRGCASAVRARPNQIARQRARRSDIDVSGEPLAAPSAKTARADPRVDLVGLQPRSSRRRDFGAPAARNLQPRLQRRRCTRPRPVSRDHRATGRLADAQRAGSSRRASGGAAVCATAPRRAEQQTPADPLSNPRAHERLVKLAPHDTPSRHQQAFIAVQSSSPSRDVRAASGSPRRCAHRSELSRVLRRAGSRLICATGSGAALAPAPSPSVDYEPGQMIVARPSREACRRTRIIAAGPTRNCGSDSAP